MIQRGQLCQKTDSTILQDYGRQEEGQEQGNHQSQSTLSRIMLSRSPILFVAPAVKALDFL
jgi:hypothetical protein